MKKIIGIFLISLLLVAACGKFNQGNVQEVLFTFYKENFLLQNFDIAQKLTKGISKEKLKTEANKVNNKLIKNNINKFSIAYRRVSNATNSIEYQLFSIDLSQLVNINLVKSNGKWKVTKFTTKIFNNPDKMVEFLNSHEWKEKQLTNEKK